MKKHRPVNGNLPEGFRKCSDKACPDPIQPETDAHFYRNKGKLQGYCKVCTRRRTKKRNDANREAIRAAYYANQEAALDYARAYREANRNQIRARQNERRRLDADAYNKKARERQAAWRRMNPEAALEKGRANYRKNAANYNSYKRIRYQADPTLRARIHDRSVEWARRNPEKAKAGRSAIQQRRRARKKGMPSKLKPRDWRTCLAYWGNRCAVCGEADGLFIHVVMDHWIPIASPNCPGTVPQNVLPLCHGKSGTLGGCNSTKSKRDPIEWLNWKLGPKKAKKKLTEIEAYFDNVNTMEKSA